MFWSLATSASFAFCAADARILSCSDFGVAGMTGSLCLILGIVTLTYIRWPHAADILCQ
jgi:hypothetical protein